MIRRPYVKRCHECRRRKRKCGGEEPKCLRCVESKHECPGYTKPGLDIVIVGPPKPRGSSKRSQTKLREGDKPSSKIEGKKGLGQETSLSSKDSKHGDVSSLITRSTTPVYGQPDYQKIEEIATLSFLRDIWLAQTRTKENSFSPSIYMDGWHKYVFSEADAEDGAMIQHCLNAAGTSFMGGIAVDMTMIRKGRLHYQKTLQALRATSSRLLQKITPRERDLCLLACMSCSLCAGAMKLPIETISSHLHGVEVIVKHCGVDTLDTDTSREVYIDYRTLNFSMSLLVSRGLWPFTQPLHTPTWWPSFPPACSPIQKLIDDVSSLPFLLERFMPIQTQSDSHRDEALQILSESYELLGLVENWHERYQNTPFLPEPKTSTPAIWLLPNRPLSTQPFPFAYTYPTYKSAMSKLFATSITIALLEHLIAVIIYLDPLYSKPSTLTSITTFRTRSLQLAELICQSVEFFVAPEQGLAGRLTVIAPFPMAVKAFVSAKIMLMMKMGAKAQDSKENVSVKESGDADMEEMKRLDDMLAWCGMAEKRIGDWFPDWSVDSWNKWFL